MINTILKTSQTILSVAGSHLLIDKVQYGSIDKIDDITVVNKTAWLHYQSSNVRNNTIEVSFNLIIMDKESSDRSNEDKIQSDCTQIGIDIVSRLNQLNINNSNLDINSVRIEPFVEKYTDYLAGVNISFVYKIRTNYDTCNAPFDDSVISTNLDEYVTYVNKFLTCTNLSDCSTFSDLVERVVILEQGGGGGGLTCNNLSGCTTIQNIQLDITNLENNKVDNSTYTQFVEDINTLITNLQNTKLDTSVFNSFQTSVNNSLGTKVTANPSITGGTATKVTYDSKGLITSATNATTSDINDSTDRRYVTDAQRTVIQNTSNTNSGDETASSIRSKVGNASSSNTGVLSSTDWTTFNNKLDSSTLDTMRRLFTSQRGVAAPTGTLNTEAELFTIVIPAGTLSTTGRMWIEHILSSTGSGAETRRFRIRIGTSNSNVLTNTLIADYICSTSGNSSVVSDIQKLVMNSLGTSLITPNTGALSSTNSGALGIKSAMSTLSYNPASQILYITVTYNKVNNTANSMIVEDFAVYYTKS